MPCPSWSRWAGCRDLPTLDGDMNGLAVWSAQIEVDAAVQGRNSVVALAAVLARSRNVQEGIGQLARPDNLPSGLPERFNQPGPA